MHVAVEFIAVNIRFNIYIYIMMKKCITSAENYNEIFCNEDIQLYIYIGSCIAYI